MDIQLIIKSPNQNIDDFTVHCNLDWTIEQLKKFLSQSYPNKPGVRQQKLIYSGRLLHDHLQLKDILRRDDGQSSVHIFHLVCSGDSRASPVQHSTSSQNRSNQPSTSQSSNDFITEYFSGNTLRHRSIGPLTSTEPINPQQTAVSSPSTIPAFTPDSPISIQMAVMQQIYAYYFSNYMQSVNPPPVPVSNVVSPNVVNFQQPPNAIEPVAPPPAPPRPVNQINNNPRRPVNQINNNAGRPLNQINNNPGPLAMDENDEGVHRDWLEHAFLCCRFLVFFCVVYFYSSPERLMIVIVGTIVLFLYHEGWFVRRANPAGPADLHVNPLPFNILNVAHGFVNNENELVLVNQDLGANVEVNNELELEAAMDGEEPPHVQNPDVANNNYIFSPLTFLQIFFASLIPEPPPPVNIN